MKTTQRAVLKQKWANSMNTFANTCTVLTSNQFQMLQNKIYNKWSENKMDAHFCCTIATSLQVTINHSHANWTCTFVFRLIRIRVNSFLSVCLSVAPKNVYFLSVKYRIENASNILPTNLILYYCIFVFFFFSISAFKFDHILMLKCCHEHCLLFRIVMSQTGTKQKKKLKLHWTFVATYIFT